MQTKPTPQQPPVASPVSIADLMAASTIKMAFRANGTSSAKTSEVEALFCGLSDQRSDLIKDLIVAVATGDYVAAGKRLDEINGLDGLLIDLGLDLCALVSKNAAIIEELTRPSGKTEAEREDEANNAYAESIRKIIGEPREGEHRQAA